VQKVGASPQTQDLQIKRKGLVVGWSVKAKELGNFQLYRHGGRGRLEKGTRGGQKYSTQRSLTERGGRVSKLGRLQVNEQNQRIIRKEKG